MEDTRDVRRVPLDKCFKDERYQRPTDGRRAVRIADKIDPNRLMIITVSERDDGRFAVLDGGHRVEAMRQADYVDTWAHVLHGLTHNQEADLFVLLDGGDMHHGTIDNLDQVRSEIVRQNPYQVFKARKEGQDVLALEAQKILTKHGFSAAAGGTDVRNINSLALVQSLCRRSKTALDKAFADFNAMVVDAKVSASAITAVFALRTRGVITKRSSRSRVPRDMIEKLRSYQVSRINSAAKPFRGRENPSGDAEGGYGANEANSLLSLLNVGKRAQNRWRLGPVVVAQHRRG